MVEIAVAAYVVGRCVDHDFDDNADDSCPFDHAHSSAARRPSSLFTGSARSWQCGGQGFESP
jgi:hypothetical protein